MWSCLVTLIFACCLACALACCPSNWATEQGEAHANEASDLIYLMTCAPKWYMIFFPCTRWRITGIVYASNKNASSIIKAVDTYCECTSEESSYCNRFKYRLEHSVYRCVRSVPNVCDKVHFNRSIGQIIDLPASTRPQQVQTFGYNFRIYYISEMNNRKTNIKSTSKH